MKKSLLYRLFGIGGIPRKTRSQLEAEGILIADEGMGGCMISRKVKSPDRRCFHREEGFIGWLAVTRRRIVCFTLGRRQINIPVADEKIRELHVKIPAKDTLSISFDSAAFRKDWSGNIEFRFRTEKGRQFHDALISMGARGEEKAENGGNVECGQK